MWMEWPTVSVAKWGIGQIGQQAGICHHHQAALVGTPVIGADALLVPAEQFVLHGIGVADGNIAQMHAVEIILGKLHVELMHACQHTVGIALVAQFIRGKHDAHLHARGNRRFRLLVIIAVTCGHRAHKGECHEDFLVHDALFNLIAEGYHDDAVVVVLAYDVLLHHVG